MPTALRLINFEGPARKRTKAPNEVKIVTNTAEETRYITKEERVPLTSGDVAAVLRFLQLIITKYTILKPRVAIKKKKIYHQPVQTKANNPVANPASESHTTFHFLSLASSASRNNQAISTGKKTVYTSVSELSPVVLDTKNELTASKKAVKNPPTLFLLSFLPMKNPGMTVSAEKITPTKKKVYISGKSPNRLRN